MAFWYKVLGYFLMIVHEISIEVYKFTSDLHPVYV